jgi:hypothetical protein
MMPDVANGDIETFHERGWHNRIEGQGGVLSTHYDAESAGREMARERGPSMCRPR